MDDSKLLGDGVCVIRSEGQTGQGFVIDDMLVTAAHVVTGPIKWISCLQHGELSRHSKILRHRKASAPIRDEVAAHPFEIKNPTAWDDCEK